ncbi:hypothetical protein IAT40_007137 [Kwoniella sp. CBS 6097]
MSISGRPQQVHVHSSSSLVDETAIDSARIQDGFNEKRTRITFAPPPAGPYSSTTLYIFSSMMFMVSVISMLLGISYVYCPAQAIPILKPICEDTHYRYIVPLLVPVTAWFGIANWVGWEYFRYA